MRTSSSRTTAFVAGGVIIVLLLAAAAWLAPNATKNAVAPTDAKTTATTRQDKIQSAYLQQNWTATNQITASKQRLAKLLSTPAPSRRPAAELVPANIRGVDATLADSACPSIASNSGAPNPGVDQAVIMSGQGSGPSTTLGTGTIDVANPTCGSINPALNQGSTVWISVGSGAAVCIKPTNSQSGPTACNGNGDAILTSNSAGNYTVNNPIASITVMDTTNFLMQFNACPGCNLRGAGLSGVTLEPQADLTGADLSGAVLYNSNFSQANLTNAKFNVFNGQQAEIADTDIQNSTLNGASFDSTDFYETDFTGSTFNCPQFSNTVVSGVIFADTSWSGGCTSPQFTQVVMNLNSLTLSTWPNLYISDSSIYSDQSTYQSMAGQTFTGLRFVGSTFLGRAPSFVNTNFTGTTLDGSTFYLTNMQGAQFQSNGSATTSMVGTDFSNAMLESANFSGSTVAANFTNAYLVNSDFSAATLSSGMDNASFASADVHGANFSNATSTNTYGIGVDFSNSYLWPGTNNVNFNNAHLPGSDFSGALLANTDFNGQADLTGANFSDAQCIMCDFTDAKLDSSQFVSSYIYGSVFGGSTMTGANFSNAACCSQGTWVFPAPSNAAAPNTAYKDSVNNPNLSGSEFDGVAACPNGQPSSPGNSGCQGQDLPIDPPTPNPACVSAGGSFGNSYCPADINLLGGNGTQGYSNGGADAKALNAEFNQPSRVLLSQATQELLISDSGNHRVRAISGLSAQEPSISDVVGNGTAGDSGDGGAASSAELNSPQGLAEVPNTGNSPNAGAIAIADSGSNNVRLYSPASGNISLYAGSGTACAQPVGSCGDGSYAIDAQLSAPQGVWFDSGGNLYIADTGNHKVRRVDATTHLISTFAGNGSTTLPSGTTSGTCQNGQPATSVGMDSPTDVTGDRMGNIYIVDQGGQQVYQVDPNGCLTIPDSGLTTPSALTTDKLGSIFVADPGENSIVSFSAWGIPQTVVGSGTAGNTGNGGPAATAELNGPQGVASSSGGVLYVADTANQQIRVAQPPS